MKLRAAPIDASLRTSIMDSVNDALEPSLPGSSHVGMEPRRFDLEWRPGESHAAPATSPLAVYTLGVDDIKAGRGLAAARLSTYRVMSPTGLAPFAADVVTKGGEAIGNAQVNSGPRVNEAVDAIKGLLDNQDNGESEVRFISVPGLYVEGLWLPEQDVVVPLNFDAHRGQLSQIAFEGLLESLARKVSVGQLEDPDDEDRGTPLNTPAPA